MENARTYKEEEIVSAWRNCAPNKNHLRKSGSGGPASKSVRVEMVNLLEPGTLRVWDLACGGNSEIYQRPQGARSYRARVRLGRIRDALLTISTRGDSCTRVQGRRGLLSCYEWDIKCTVRG